MSFQKYALSLDFSLHRSRALNLFLLLLHGGALFWAFYLVWPVWVKFSLAVLIVGSLWLVVQRHWFFVGPRVVVNIRHNDGLDWQLTLVSGDVIDAQLQQSTYFPVFLAVLNFRQLGCKRAYSVVVMFDSADGESLRRLGVKLRVMSEST